MPHNTRTLYYVHIYRWIFDGKPTEQAKPKPTKERISMMRTENDDKEDAFLMGFKWIFFYARVYYIYSM